MKRRLIAESIRKSRKRKKQVPANEDLPEMPRGILLIGLSHEYDRGDAVSRLYVAMLARALIVLEPELIDLLPHTIALCGVFEGEDS